MNNASNTPHHFNQHGQQHHHALTHIRSGSSSTASTSTAKASKTSRTSTSTSRKDGGGDDEEADDTGRDTLWRAEGPSNATAGNTKGSVYSMKKVSSSSPKKKQQSTKAKGKQVAREVAGLPNGHHHAYPSGANDDDDLQDAQDHDRDGTIATYRTANEAGEDESSTATGSDEEDGDDDDGDGESASEASSAGMKSQEQLRSSSHDRSKRPSTVQDIFQSDTLTKVRLCSSFLFSVASMTC